MAEVITFPDATQVVIDGLDPNITVPVLSRVPNPRPVSFVTIRRVGGVRRNIVTDSPTVTAEAWAETDEDAHDLAQQVRAHVHALVGTQVDGVLVCKVDEFAGPAHIPDPTSNTPRYTQTFSISLR